MKWWNKGILFFTIIILIALAGSYFAIYISPEDFWPIAFLGLAYLPLFIVFLLLCIYWLFVRRQIFFLLLIFLMIGYKAHLSYFSFGALSKNNTSDDKPIYQILQYNVEGFDAYNPKGKYLKRNEIMDNIKQADADIACLQEFSTYHDHPTEKSNLNMVLNATGLKNYYYYKAYENRKHTRSFGLIILSRFPIIKKGVLEYKSLSKLNSTIYADVKIKNDTVRIFCSHLQSTQINHNDFEFIEPGDTTQTNFDPDRVTNKLKTSYTLRALEADSVAAAISRCRHPVISCGDFNDTPVSFAYRKMSNNMQDAFLEKGFGIGATYTPMPVIRIDYLLFDEARFNIVAYNRINKKSCDHYPCVATFTIN